MDSPPKAITPYPTIGTAFTGIFSLLVLAWWLEVGLRVGILGAIRFEFILAATASACALARPIKRLEWSKKANAPILRSIIIFIVVLLLSLPFAIDAQRSFATIIDHVVKFAVLGVLISYYVASPSTLRIYLFTTLVAFLKVGQEAFLGKVTGNMVWENQGVPRLHGAGGTMFGDPNALSGKTVSTMPFLYYLFPQVRQRWIKILLLVQLVFSFNIIIFTASRTGYLTLIAEVIIIVLLSKANRARLAVAAFLLAGAAVMFLPQAYKDRFTSSFTGEEKEGHSADTRKELFFDALLVFSQNPLGVGPEGFMVVQERAGRNAQPTHNLYTQILAETGIQGAFCFTMLVGTVLRSSIRARRRFTQIIQVLRTHAQAAGQDLTEPIATEVQNANLFLATTDALMIFILVRLVLGVFGHDLLEIYWWIAAGLAMALNNLLAIAARRCAEITGTDVLGGLPSRGRRRASPVGAAASPLGR